MSRLRPVLLALLPLLGATAATAATPAPASAQVSQIARVAGMVRDEAGKPIAGASITASNPDQAPATFTASTDGKGRFAILGLRRGSWTFSVAAPGFKTTRVAGDVLVGRPNAPINVTLMKGTPAVSGPAPTVTGAELQEVIEDAEGAAARGDLDGAIKGYRDLVSRVPALTAGQLRLAALLEEKGDGPGALEVYRQVLRIEPDNTRAAAAAARLARTP